MAEREIQLENENFFVIGDNISKSKDSRYSVVGLVSSDKIVGVVLGEK